MKNLKLNKKGFTLIELLAVIVVLAIIIVIAVPSVLNIQKNAKKGTTEDEALMLVKSIELCISSEQSLAKCLPTDDAAAALDSNVTETKIGDYYEKASKFTAAEGETPEASYSFTTTATVDTPAFQTFSFEANDYTIAGTGTASDSLAVISLGSSLSATKTAIADAFK